MSSRIRTHNNGGKGGIRTQWSSQSYSLREIREQFNLPIVVRCNPQTLFTKRSQPLPVNLGQPILLYKTRTARKLLARNVLYDTRVQRFGETEETVVIPEDYEGNFLRLKSRMARDESYHTGVESLAKNQVPAFLNLSSLTAFQISENQNSNVYPRLEFAPGNVFIVDRVFKGSSKHIHDHTRQELHYLKCRDERNTDILVPMSHAGDFIEVLANPVEGSSKLSMPSRDIISIQKFPQLLRYVYGGTRPRITPNSGLFTALDSFEESSFVGCVITSSGYTLIEMPIASPLSFQIALNTTEILNVPILKRAVGLCDKTCTNFAQDMKFKFKFALRILETSPEAKKIQDEDDPPSATNSARFGITQTYIYI